MATAKDLLLPAIIPKVPTSLGNLSVVLVFPSLSFTSSLSSGLKATWGTTVFCQSSNRATTDWGIQITPLGVGSIETLSLDWNALGL